MKATSENIQAIKNVIDGAKCKSAWDRGVKIYAGLLLENLEEYAHYSETHGGEMPEITEAVMLNGAADWRAYSWGGCALIYDYEIAETLCTPSELKQCKGGQRRPNRLEAWLDVQARALYQAAQLIINTARS